MQEGRLWLIALFVLGLGTNAGCGNGGGGGLFPVEGKVTLDHQPLAEATVAFSPTKATGTGPFIGTTDAEGRFALGPAGNERGGAAIGQYIVTIITVKPDPNAMEGSVPTQREIVPMAFRDGSMRIDVPEDGKTDFGFDMKTR